MTGTGRKRCQPAKIRRTRESEEERRQERYHTPDEQQEQEERENGAEEPLSKRDAPASRIAEGLHCASAPAPSSSTQPLRIQAGNTVRVYVYPEADYPRKATPVRSPPESRAARGLLGGPRTAGARRTMRGWQVTTEPHQCWCLESEETTGKKRNCC